LHIDDVAYNILTTISEHCIKCSSNFQFCCYFCSRLYTILFTTTHWTLCHSLCNRSWAQCHTLCASNDCTSI